MTVTSAAEQTGEVRRELDRARAVFLGEVIGRNVLTVRFRVEAVWKGKIPSEFALSSGTKLLDGSRMSSSSCDLSFQVGKRYVVFAYGSSLETMKATSCSLTMSMPDAADTVMFLDTLVISRPPTGQDSKLMVLV
ncbi:hypothetical protein, partial [Bradyrhizobium sp. NBAIM08]|uniref:hypothetical protein n=1 Tax=Bradyrhizobium sp. NBAIM08 TaxID=2793815 RepID=UPI001CD1D616